MKEEDDNNVKKYIAEITKLVSIVRVTRTQLRLKIICVVSTGVIKAN